MKTKKKIIDTKKSVSLKKKSIKFKPFKLPRNIYPKKFIILFSQPKKRIPVHKIKFNFYPNKIKLDRLDKYFIEHKEYIKKKDNIQRLTEIVGGDKLVKLTKYLNFYDFTSNANIGNTPLMTYNIDLNFGWSNAWRKMYEMIQDFKLINVNLKKLTHFDMCGFPGAFVFATNHYVKTKTNIKEYDWFINSYKEELKDGDIKQKYLTDKFNLQKKYPDRFLYGAGNGDITDIKNINEYKKFFNNREVDLVSSDCGLQIKWDESYLREEQMIKIHFGQFVCGISVLKKGGNFVMKNYSQMKLLSVSIIYLMILTFEKVYLSKPESSRQYGNEIYLVGKNFKKNLSEDQLTDLLQLVNKLENKKHIKYSLFQNMDSHLVRSIEDKLCYYYKNLKKMKHNKDKLFEEELFSLKNNAELVEKKLKHLKESSKYQIKGYFKNYFRKLKYQRIKKGDKLL